MKGEYNVTALKVKVGKWASEAHLVELNVSNLTFNQ